MKLKSFVLIFVLVKGTLTLPFDDEDYYNEDYGTDDDVPCSSFANQDPIPNDNIPKGKYDELQFR